MRDLEKMELSLSVDTTLTPRQVISLCTEALIDLGKSTRGLWVRPGTPGPQGFPVDLMSSFGVGRVLIDPVSFLVEVTEMDDYTHVFAHAVAYTTKQKKALLVVPLAPKQVAFAEVYVRCLERLQATLQPTALHRSPLAGSQITSGLSGIRREGDQSEVGSMIQQIVSDADSGVSTAEIAAILGLSLEQATLRIEGLRQRGLLLTDVSGLHFPPRPPQDGGREGASGSPVSGLATELLAQLSDFGSADFGALAWANGLPARDVTEALAELVSLGLVQDVGGGVYSIGEPG